MAGGKGQQEELWKTVKTAVSQEYHVLKTMGLKGRERIIEMSDRRKVASDYMNILQALVEAK